MHSPIREAVPDRRWVYPEEHLAAIGPFIWGNDRDPRDAFTLSSDTWVAWQYATNAREALRGQTRLGFTGLASFLRPYAKWFAGCQCGRLVRRRLARVGAGGLDPHVRSESVPCGAVDPGGGATYAGAWWRQRGNH